MDRNEDVAKELASHTSKLSTYLQHFQEKSVAEEGDELAIYIENLHKYVGGPLANTRQCLDDDFLRELQDARKKVDRWNSAGDLKKAFLTSDSAKELKSRQDTVQNALEEMQVRCAAGHLLAALTFFVGSYLSA